MPETSMANLATRRHFENEGNDFYLYNDQFPETVMENTEYTLHRIGRPAAGPQIAPTASRFEAQGVFRREPRGRD
jgi:hypothetical protein